MAILDIEDITDHITCVMFSRTWETFKNMVVEDQVLIMRGKADKRDGDMQIIVESVSQEFSVQSEDTTLKAIRNTQFDWLEEEPIEENPFLNDVPDFIATEPACVPEPVIASDATAEDTDNHSDDDDLFFMGDSDEEDLLADVDDVDIDTEAIDEGIAEELSPNEWLNEVDETPYISPYEADASAFDSPETMAEEAWAVWELEDTSPAPPENKPVTTVQTNNPTPRAYTQDGRLIPPSAPAAIPRQVSTRRRLEITLFRTGDGERDYRLLRWMYSKALSFPGGDEICVFVRGEESSENFRMNFPKLSIAINDLLLKDLREKLGEKSIRIVELPA
jgi:DNA polymerase-3 subunit alpha